MYAHCIYVCAQEFLAKSIIAPVCIMQWMPWFTCAVCVICATLSCRMAELGLSREDGRVVFGEQLGMCDHISSSLG